MPVKKQHLFKFRVFHVFRKRIRTLSTCFIWLHGEREIATRFSRHTRASCHLTGHRMTFVAR